MMRPLPFWRDRRGGVAFLTALWAVPALIGVAAAVNYGLCIESRSRLNAMADAATLAVVSTGKISEPAAQAGSDAETLFRSAAATLPGVTITSVDVSISSTDSSTTTVKRVATLRYSAAFPLLMGGFLGMPSLSLTGMSEATGSTPANIDFYLLVDTSPSMAFPATSTGMDAMLAATKSQSSGNGCAFACHQTTTSATNPGGTPLDSASGKYLDNYQIAINQGISLRIDVIRSAITDLIQTVSASGGKNAATYRMAISTFDYAYSPVSAVTGDADTLTQAAQQIELLAVCTNNARVCGVSNSDMDTNFTAAFAGESDSLPAMSGTGTNNSGDTPQVVLFLLTDGMRDENVSGGRALGAIPVALCEDLKQNRNIRIAVLYTQYLVDDLQTNAWSVSHVMSFLSPTDTLEENLQSCASPGLFYEVTNCTSQMILRRLSISRKREVLVKQKIGYARVSTTGQTLDSQIRTLLEFDCQKIFREKASGANAERIQLRRLLRSLSEGDTVVVTRIDRLARSTFDLFAIVRDITRKGAQFYSMAEPWADTSTSTGRLILAVLGGLADVERDLIRTRTAEGRARAMALGVRMGRPPRITAGQRYEITERRARGEPLKSLADDFGISLGSVSRIVTGNAGRRRPKTKS